MSSSDQDSQVSALVANMNPKSLFGDTAHYLRDRSVLRVTGDLAGLANISVGLPVRDGERGRFVSLLTDSGHLDADIYVIPREDDMLIDVHADLFETVAGRLAGLDGVSDVDQSAREEWRVFGELPDQRGGETPYETIRFSDSRRRELGTRIVRHASEPEGFDWRHARKWDGHAMRLGLLPDHRCLIGKAITPEEAGYHKLLGGTSASATGDLERRVLPVRIDPQGFSVPVMAGSPLMAEDVEIGTMLDQEGVCGIALISIEPWREVIAAGGATTCRGEPVLMSWPTWLSSDSEGNCGPAGSLI